MVFLRLTALTRQPALRRPCACGRGGRGYHRCRLVSRFLRAVIGTAGRRTGRPIAPHRTTATGAFGRGTHTRFPAGNVLAGEPPGEEVLGVIRGTPRAGAA